MSLSDRERRLLDEMARRLQEQEPGLASAMRDWSEPAGDHTTRRPRAVSRWRRRFQESQRAPLRTAVAVGLAFIAGLLLTGHGVEAAPDSAGNAEVARSTLQFTPL